MTVGIPEARVSLMAGVIRQTLRDYGHKTAESSLPEYIAADLEVAFLQAGEPISSSDLIKNCSGDPDAPFERGPFPPEMRTYPQAREGDVGERLRKTVEQLSSTGMSLSLAQWNEVSNTILEAADALTALQAELTATVSQRDEWQAIALDLQSELKARRCVECQGQGQVPRSFGFIPCPACNGKGA